MNPMLRIDAAIARAVSPFLSGDKSALMPWPKEPEKVATIEDAFAILKASVRPQKKATKTTRPVRSRRLGKPSHAKRKAGAR